MYSSESLSIPESPVRISRRSWVIALAALVAAGLTIAVFVLALGAGSNKSVSVHAVSSLPQYRDMPPAPKPAERPATLAGLYPAPHALLPVETGSQGENTQSAAQRMATLRVQRLLHLGR
ncbi:MAG TPA: hypothetical protein VEF89_20225 [Solirubrobacteraceae bacterium]|nr:hypothetical protein [Solirubrobacteraceae bacterium]